MTRRRIDWTAAKAAYLYGMEIDGKREPNPTLEEVARHFGIGIGTVRTRSMERGWTEERRLFQARLEERKADRAVQILAGEGAEFDALALRVARKQINLIEKRLDKAVEAEQGLSPAEVRALAGSLKDAQYAGRLALGDSTENARVQDDRSDDDARAEELANRLAAKLNR